MTAKIETIITCDGGPECPEDQAYGVGSTSQFSAKLQRAGYWMNGWVYWKGKDYCAACANRLGLQPAKKPTTKE